MVLCLASIKNYAQNEIDSINNILVGKWIWSECIPAPFDCFEQPSVNLSRSIAFFEAPNDSLLYKTYKNDSLIEEGKIKIKKNTNYSWLIKEDIVFGDSINGIKFNEHKIVIENDTTIKITLGGDYKSSVVYKYEKKDITTYILENKYPKNNSYISGNNPNPFIENTEIQYNISNNVTNANINIYNVQGRQIKNIPIKNRSSNKIEINGCSLEAGIYLYMLITDGKIIDKKKMVLIK